MYVIQCSVYTVWYCLTNAILSLIVFRSTCLIWPRGYKTISTVQFPGLNYTPLTPVRESISWPSRCLRGRHIRKNEIIPIWIWTSRIDTKSDRSDIEIEPDKTIRRAPKNRRPRRGQTSFGHVEKPHFGVSVICLSKWNRVRNVLLEVMPNWSRG
jgi:hypothetical protein